MAVCSYNCTLLCRDERQWRDISYCLSKLAYSDKAIKKLIELFGCYGDKLADDAIYGNFMNLISSASQRLKVKPGSKVRK